MRVPEPMGKSPIDVLSRCLRRYDSSEVALINTYTHLFENVPRWNTWIEETFLDLLQVPAGRQLELVQSSELHSGQTQTYTFEKKEISIGRGSENDIALPMRSISRLHARIVEREDGFYLEDLGSASGTYVNRQRLEQAQPRRLGNGDEVLIFPYVLRAIQKELWSSDSEVKFAYSPRVHPTSNAEFISECGSDLSIFQLRIHPEMGDAFLALDRSLLAIILSRLVRESITEFAESDSTLLEFIVVSILERANKQLRFPFQCLLVPSKRLALHEESGFILRTSVHLTDAQGSMLLFVPKSCFQKLQTVRHRELPVAMKGKISCRVMVSTGFVDLTTRELEDLRLGDTVLYNRGTQLILPNVIASRAQEQGWWAVQSEENPRCFEIKESFERSFQMEGNEDVHNEIEKDGKLELGGFPVRIHIVLSQVTMSLENLESLAEGSILELDEAHSGVVELTVNGEVLGLGDLVVIEDRLGVQITRWGKA